MPFLYYGKPPYGEEKGLYKPPVDPSKGGVVPVGGSVFDSYKIDHLAPKSGKINVANFWWFLAKKHSAFSWHDSEGLEHTLFIPSLLNWREALIMARNEFESVVPSAITFRLNNYKRVYTYD